MFVNTNYLKKHNIKIYYMKNKLNKNTENKVKQNFN